MFLKGFVQPFEFRGMTRIIRSGVSCLWTFDFYGPLRYGFDAGRSNTRASGRGLGPGNLDFFGPCEMAEMALSR
jgi:hypothetical protein